MRQRMLSKRVAIQELSLAMSDIQRQYSIVERADIVSHTDDGESFLCGDGLVDLLENGMLRVSVGASGILECHHHYIDMDVFCETMLSVKHEQEHVHQYAVIYKEHTDAAKAMALDHAATFYNPRFYRYNYGNMLHEIDANIEGIKSTKSYFQKNFPDYDIDTALCEIMYKRQSSSPYGWFTDERRKFSSVDEMVASMERHKHSVSEYRPHFTYPKRSADEYPDRLEQYIEDAPRSFRLTWDDLDGLSQRNVAARLNLTERPGDMRCFKAVLNKNTANRGKLVDEGFRTAVDDDIYGVEGELDQV